MTSWLLALLLATPAAVSEIELHPLRGLKADVATLILAGREGGALRAAAVAVPGPRGALDATRRVAIWVEVDGASLLAEGSPDELPESLRAELWVYAMTPTGELAASLGRRLTVPATALRGSRLKLATSLDLAPGEYRFHVLVRELRSQRFALRLEPLTLAPATEAKAIETNVVEGGWLVSRADPEEAPGSGAATASGLFAWNPLRPIRGEAADEEAQSAAIELSRSRQTSKRIRAAADAYRDVLERLASGRFEDAVDRLHELESDAEAHKIPKRAWDWLFAGQERVIQLLAENDPESLLPLLVLHVERHDRALRERRVYSFGSIFTRQRIATLARAYGESAQTDLAPVLAATALTDFGASYVRDQRYGIGRRILESALAFDDDNVAALFCLAFIEERDGRYKDSVDALRRALAVVPGSEEGRLRLALGLRRLGSSDEAVSLLGRLVEEASEGWVLTIAYEELGRLLLAREGAEAAARLLEQGLSRLPEQQRLHAQLSYFLDRSGERRRGHEVLAGMPADTGRESPRSRYGEPPCDDGGSRELLLRHSTARLPVLAEVLAVLESR